MRLPLRSSSGPNSEQLPGKARTKFRCPNELYAHVVLAKLHGISEEKVATIRTEQRTGDLTHKEAIAYDITSALIAGLVPPVMIYDQAVGLFVKMEQRNSSILSVCTESYRSP
jgi:hypothetical protein